MTFRNYTMKLLFVLIVSGCGDGAAKKVDPDIVPAWQRARQLDYLAFACEQPLDPSAMWSLLGHLECELRFDGFTVQANSVPTDAWDYIFDKLWSLRDTSDFDMMRIINLLYAHRGHPAVPESLWQKLEKALFDFKYWYTDPTPDRVVDGEQVVDMMWYWSENHILLFRTGEYLSGQRYPDQVFRTTGMTGAEHRDRAREAILDWLDERARWGFAEWHSNVYYKWDMVPLISLLEWAEDPEIATRAAMVLDLVWLDVALHLHRGTFGATHGRSFIKDIPSADLEDTFDSAKIFFDDTELPYQSATSTDALLFARANKYHFPWVIRTIARHDSPITDRERMNLPLDERPPDAWDDPVEQPPYGLSYEDEEDLTLWWSMNAYMAWPLLPMTFDVAGRYDLWNGQFGTFDIISDLIDLEQPVEGIIEDVHGFYRPFWRGITSALLKEAHTYTYRTGNYMLSSVQDYRPGSQSVQIHPWQATLGERAIVFTQHPAYLALDEGEEMPEQWDWQESDEPGPGYWTGEGSLPRIGQHENVAVIIYAPQFTPQPLGLDIFQYREETHAYFPHAHFDEVVQDGNWTFGRKDDGYIALYSFRPTQWREGQPDVFQNGGQPFDLVAPDGPDNAWIVELGAADPWDSFAAFQSAINAATVTVTPVADQDDDGFDDGYDVEYQSPSQGTVKYGWHSPLSVDGTEVPQRWEYRYDNPFVQTNFNETYYSIAIGTDALLLDFATANRLYTKPPESS